MASTKVPNRQVSLESRRIRLEREVKIRVPQFDSFVTEYSSNISTTGMFILTANPKPPGTVISFEFSVADDWKLIRGQAQVVWVRHRAEGPDQPPGMGVRFVELDGQSRRLIRWIVEKHIREGGKPFELDDLRTVIDEALDQVLDTDEEFSTSKAPIARSPVSAKPIVQKVRRSRPDSQLMPLLITAVVVVVLVAVLFWLTEYLPRSSDDGGAVAATSQQSVVDPSAGDGGDEADSATPAGEPDEGSATGEAVVAETADAEDEEAAALDTPPVGSAYAAVAELVEGWSDAWGDQDVDRYLSFYSRSFRPPDGASRATWAAERRDRIEGPGYIRIAISGLELDRVDDDRVVATFFQGYRSDRFNDEVRKRLELIWEEGGWRIARETTL